MMRHRDYVDLAHAIVPIVLQAGALERGYFRTNVSVEIKADASPVTIADREAEAVILDGLAKAYPDIPVIAEERVSAGDIPAIEDQFFLVDPLDGTREFVNGRGEFTVNIALVEQGTVTFGAIFAPISSDLYVTMTANHAIHAMAPITTDPQHLTDLTTETIHTASPDLSALVVALSGSHPSKTLERQLDKLPIKKRVRAGSSIKFCLLARGEADLYPRLSSISQWDIAAGHAILQAAGGSVSTLDGTPLRYGRTEHNFRADPFVAWSESCLPPHIQFTAETNAIYRQ